MHQFHYFLISIFSDWNSQKTECNMCSSDTVPLPRSKYTCYICLWGNFVFCAVWLSSLQPTSVISHTLFIYSIPFTFGEQFHVFRWSRRSLTLTLQPLPWTGDPDCSFQLGSDVVSQIHPSSCLYRNKYCDLWPWPSDLRWIKLRGMVFLNHILFVFTLDWNKKIWRIRK